MSGEQQQLRIAITGGTSGLGLALVQELLGRGAQVAFVARRLLAERVGLVFALREDGQRAKYRHDWQGYTARLDTIQAAVLRVKLRHLDHWNALRREHAAAYARALARSSLMIPQPAPWAEHVWHLYVVRSAGRDAIRAALGARGVETGLHYPLPLPLQPALERLGHVRGEFPVTESWADELLSLPMFPELEQDEIALIGEVIAECEAAA